MKIKCGFLLGVAAAACATLLPRTAECAGFDRAEPVWVEGKATEMNSMYAFCGEFEGKSAEKCMLRITGCGAYRVYVNGEFAGYGPARGSIGFFRVDEWEVTKHVRGGLNAVAVEVSAYNVNNYYLPDQPGFIQAEVLSGGKCVLSTPEGFRAVKMPRVRKAPRFSFQRGFCEAYVLDKTAYSWRSAGKDAETLPIEKRPATRLLDRRAPYPLFEMTDLALSGVTTVKYDAAKKFDIVPFIDFAGVPGKKIKGFTKDELEVNVWAEARRSIVVKTEKTDNAKKFAVAAGRGALLGADIVRTGFFGAEVEVRKPGRLVVYFDEVLTSGKVGGRGTTSNCFVYDFKDAGTYRIENFEPNTFMWVHAFTHDGDFTLSSPYVRNYRTPAADKAVFKCSDPALVKIFEAARETFAQNSVDVFMDCPGRERAGWLCDSYFTAKSSKLLTGKNDLEDLFIENFLLPEKFDIDDGMLPMCYPSDHTNGNYIPNWAMWFVIQLEEYARERSGDREIIEKFKPRILKLVAFLSKYENSDGLLERLPRWVFLEWSHANKLVQDVNYPSNMTWAEVLDCVARMYSMPEYAAKAERVRETIRRQSWTGEWFCDNAVRNAEGKLVLSGECTETCQYYAFFFKTATPEKHPELWRRLTEDFGPQRKETKAWPKIWPSNAFIGNYLRLEMLSRAGLGDKVVEEIRGYFGYMAERTGTLWENDTPRASCNHGFASYTAVLLDRHATDGR